MAKKVGVDCVGIGGGSAGLFRALTASQRGRKVLMLDSSYKVGKKILMSGGGRCYFTNLRIDPENYISPNPDFLEISIELIHSVGFHYFS